MYSYNDFFYGKYEVSYEEQYKTMIDYDIHFAVREGIKKVKDQTGTTIEQLEEYFKSIPENEVVGKPKDARGCPLYHYYVQCGRELTKNGVNSVGGTYLCTGSFEYQNRGEGDHKDYLLEPFEYQNRGEGDHKDYLLEPFEVKFVNLTDDYYNELTAKDCLSILLTVKKLVPSTSPLISYRPPTF